MTYGLNQNVTLEIIQVIQILLLIFSSIKHWAVYVGSIEHWAVYVGSLVVSGKMTECFFKMVILYLPDFLKM